MPFLNSVIARRCCDILVVCFVITPLSILWWAGTWQILDISLLSGKRFVSHLISLAIGLNICILSYYANTIIVRSSRYMCRSVTCRIFNYVFSIGLINFWRGVWGLTDEIVNEQNYKAELSAAILAVSAVLLFLLRGFVMCVSLPFWISTEFGNTFQHAKPRFRSEVSIFFISPFISFDLYTSMLHVIIDDL